MIGHGLTDQPDDLEYTIPDFVNHGFSFLDAVGEKAAYVVGQSFGGWVAAWMALQEPERVKKLGIVAGAGLKVVEEGVKSSLKKTGADAIETPNLETMRKRLEHLFYSPDHLTDELEEIRLKLYQRALGRSSLKKVMEQTMGDAQTNYLLTPERLRKIQTPTLFVWGEKNPVTSPEAAQKAAREVARSEFTVMEKCGRWPQFESPAEFNRRLQEFLS
jgi:2-hydroxy-6-oxonona-2,4-dienedioate hydrolase